jgi:uncharacterized membrane protein YGL010W
MNRMGPSPTQQRFLLPLTAIFTFVAGVFAAHDQVALVMVTLALLVIGWILTAVTKLGGKSERQERSR